MTRGKGWLIAIAIFLTGAVVGALGLDAWHMMRGGPFGQVERLGPAGFIMEHMTGDLGLEPEQLWKIRPIVEEMVTKLDETRKPCIQEEEAVFEEYQAKIRATLLPQQIKRHDEMLERLRKLRQFRPPPRPPLGPPPMFGAPPGPPLGPPPMFGPPPGAPTN